MITWYIIKELCNNSLTSWVNVGVWVFGCKYEYLNDIEYKVKQVDAINNDR